MTDRSQRLGSPRGVLAGCSPAETALRSLLFSFMLLLTACSGSIQPSTIGVTGRLTGEDGVGVPVTPMSMTLVRDDDPLNARLEHAPSGGIQRLSGVDIAVDQSTGLPAAEEFVILSVSNFAFAPGSDTPPLAEQTGDAGWMRRNVGDLVVLPLRKDDITLPSNAFDAFPPAQLRPAGAAWMARIEDDDPAVPWTMPAGDANCLTVPVTASMVAPPGGQAIDCFDFETLASMFLATFALEITEVAAQADIPASTVTALEHQLYVVPNLTSSPGDPGFGMVYSVNLRVSAAGLQVAHVRVSVPLSIHFQRFGGLYVDPLSGLTDPRNIDRVTLTYDDNLINATLASNIRTAIVDALGNMTLPPLTFGNVTQPDGTVVPLSTSTENAFELFFNMVSGRESATAENFSVLALPEQRSTVTEPITNLALSIPVVTRAVSAPAPPGTTAGITAGPGGVVTVVRIGPGPGAPATTFTIPRPTVENPFKLAFLQ